MAADSFSAILGLLEQGTGNNNNTWGALLNTGVMDQVDLAVAGRSARSVTGGTLDLSGTPPPAGPSGAIYSAFEFSGTLASNQIVQVPNLPKIWLVRNLCALAGFTLTFKTPSGSASPAIPNGRCLVACDGANTILVDLSTSLRDAQWLGADGTVAAPGLSFTGDPDSGLYRVGANHLGIGVNGVEALDITTTGVDVPTGTFTIGGVAPVPPGVEADYAGITAPTGWYLEYGQTVSRTTDSALFAAITATCTGNTHSNTTLDTLSVDLRNLGLESALIEGTGIPTGTTIVSIGSATALTLSAAATSTGSTVAIRILPYGQGDASTTFNIPDRRGRAVFGRDNMGGTAASRLTGLTNGILGTKLNATGGEEAHTLITAEIPAITPAGTIGGSQVIPSVAQFISGPTAFNSGSGNQSNSITVSGSNFTFTGTSFGGGGAHNNVPPAAISNRIIKR